MKFVYKKNKGFTLIEVLISMAIFIIILTIVTVNYRQGENSNIFRLQSFDVDDSIRGVQNMALTGKQINGTIPRAYGIFFSSENNSIIIFGDNGDNIFDDNIFNGKEDSVYSTNSLYENISFRKHTLFCDTTYEDIIDLYIVFTPPEPTIMINNDSTCTSSAIFLESSTTNGIWSIYFDTISGRTWTEFN